MIHTNTELPELIAIVESGLTEGVGDRVFVKAGEALGEIEDRLTICQCERDQLRAELANLRSLFVATRDSELKYMQDLSISQKKHDAAREELAALKAPKSAPRCPKCGSIEISVHVHGTNSWGMYCIGCGAWTSGFNGIDSALDAWREGGEK